MTKTAVENFKRHWEFVHSMTLAFAEETPDEHWDFSPHARFDNPGGGTDDPAGSRDAPR
jgi:hypothetical protein